VKWRHKAISPQHKWRWVVSITNHILNSNKELN